MLSLLFQIVTAVAAVACVLLMIYLKAKSFGAGEGWPTKTKPPLSLFGDKDRPKRR
jgi:hypothetical protein